MAKILLLALSLCAVAVHANDPAGSWLSYARWDAPNEGKITALNTTWTVPSKPKTPFGSNAPGWWFGVQTKKGDGALVQPILAYGYQGSVYTIFNGVFDWTDGSWHTSPEKYTVEPGDKITSSVTYRAEDNSYDMYIASAQTGKSVTTNYKLKSGQKAVESTAYFVLEHQPMTCRAFPSDGEMTFNDISVEVEGKPVQNVQWKAMQERPKCDSKATVVDDKTIKFTWTAGKSDDTTPSPAVFPLQRAFNDDKWGFGPAVKSQGSKCPGSAATVHAKCDMSVSFTDSCATVAEEVHARVSGQSTGKWHDPHNGGKYTITSSSDTEIALEHLTGHGNYTDKLILTLGTDGSGCKVGACSESQVTSVLDYSTNFCNLHDLYCADSGCHVVKHALKYSETHNSCWQHDASKCLKD